ncbi:hypothetical protein [Microbacterium sp. LWO13-1.2]|uniref:hypothetical protein n=1 Tax=unclassified Microbacterium TaxID=2609290 RepID=UPI003138E9D1
MVDNKSQLSRRTVVKGAAWSIPVIAVAASMPLAAASLPEVGTNLGPLYASSVDISSINVNIGALQFDCYPGMTSADIVTALVHEITLTSTNAAPFDISNLIVQGLGWTVVAGATATSVTIRHVATDSTCEGFVQGPSLYFNGQVAATNSITVSALAYNADFTVAPLMIQPASGTGALVGPA